MRSRRRAGGIALAATLVGAEPAVLDPPRQPWSDAVLADVNASMPVLTSEELRLNGDVTLGYNGGEVGVVGRASAYDYEIVSSTGLTDTIRYDGEVSAWGYLTLGNKLRAELRGSVGGAFYDTTSLDARASEVFVDETSLFGRGQGTAGFRWDPSDRFVTSVVGGGGLQLESWDGNSVSTGSGARIRYVTTERSPTTVRLTLRWRAEWVALPHVLTARVRLDLESLAISRSDMKLAVDVGGGRSSVAASSDVTTVRQTELFVRMFFDIEALRFFDVRPSIHVGLNAVALGGDGSIAPVLGVGLRREAF